MRRSSDHSPLACLRSELLGTRRWTACFLPGLHALHILSLSLSLAANFLSVLLGLRSLFYTVPRSVSHLWPVIADFPHEDRFDG